MTRVERKLRKVGYDLELYLDEIKCKTNEVEIAVKDHWGDVDYDLTEMLKDRVAKDLGWGGYRCAWGGWILQKDYQSSRQFNTR